MRFKYDHQKKEMGIGLIETDQARAPKIPYSMRYLRYEARLKKWRINRLEDSEPV